jgi:hypothetical protein
MLKIADGIKVALHEGKPVIAVGGGRISLPGMDIGAGHITPAKGIYEALQKHPEVQAGKVLVQPVMPENFQIKDPIKYPDRDLTISTGFSGLPEDRYAKSVPDPAYGPDAETQAKFEQTIGKPSGKFIQFVPDTQRAVTLSDAPSLVWAGIKNPIRAYHAVSQHFSPDVVRFGQAGYTPESFFKHQDISPALTDESLDSIRQTLSGKLNTARVYGQYAKWLESTGNQEGANYIRGRIQQATKTKRPFKPILVTGSSRGDYVAQKTLDTMQALREGGLHDQYDVIPLLGKNKDVTGPLLKDTGIPAIGGAPQSLYNKLRGTAALNIGSSGASDLNELKALPAPSIIPRLQRALRDQELAKLPNLSPEHRKKLEDIDTEMWNAGGLQDIEHGKPHGMALYDGPSDILKVLKNPEFMDKVRSHRRATYHLQSAEMGKMRLADRLVEEAKRVAAEKANQQ